MLETVPKALYVFDHGWIAAVWAVLLQLDLSSNAWHSGGARPTFPSHFCNENAGTARLMLGLAIDRPSGSAD
jgi:hypothetical protein